MDSFTALLAFSIAAALLTITPGLDTALVLRTSAVEGARQAFLAGAGIAAGSLLWGIITALGLGALLAVSETAYFLLKIAGAAYLFYLGARMLADAFVRAKPAPPIGLETSVDRSGGNWFLRGLATNLLNPKVGVFYVSFLPQFIPAGANVAVFSVLMAAIHALMGIAWFAILIRATQPLSRVLRKPSFTRALDGVTGAILIAFGLRLAFDRRI
jgi:threonine/homoserine/homoserine lactone efflux protein